MPKLLLSALLIAAVFIISSCDEDEYVNKGTVVYQDIEGGFYGIIDEDGNKYDPIGLPEEFKQDSLRVEFAFQKRTDLSSFHMWGTIIEVIKIRKLEE